jgi:hypothetical protein
MIATTMPERSRVTDDDVHAIGERLRWARETCDPVPLGLETPRDRRFLAHGLPLRDFAEYLTDRGYAIDWNTMRRYEVAHNAYIPVGYVLMVARVTKLRVEWLMTGRGAPR